MRNKIKFLTTATDLSRTTQLKRSLDYYDWDYKIVQHTWTGFGSKLIAARNALPALKDEGYTHFIYGDSYDSFVLGPMQELHLKVPDWNKQIHSTEKANFPHPNKMYPPSAVPHSWRFLNGGGFFAPIDLYMQIFDSNPCPAQQNDQEYQVDMFLNQKGNDIQLEKGCDIFQCYSFIDEDNDFKYGDTTLFNNITGTFPLLIHGNGHTPMDRIYNLIK